MRTRILLAIAFVLLASAAYAQNPFPNGVKIGDGWVPCDHPLAIAAGLGCVPAPSQVQPAAPGSTPSGYGSIERSDLGTRFELGKTYESPYGFRVTIIGTARKTDGTYVFVGEVIRSGGYPRVGDLLSFPCNEDRGPFQFEVPPDQVASEPVVR